MRCALAATMVLILTGFSAQALAVPSDKAVLILEVRDGSRQSPRLAAQLEEALQRRGFSFVSSRLLSAGERACRAAAGCLQGIGQKHQVSYVIWALLKDTQAHRRFLQVWTLRIADQRPAQDARISSAEQTEEALAELTEQVLLSYGEQTGSAGAAVLEQPEHLQRLTVQGLAPWRKGVAISLGLLSAILLGGAITMTLLDGKRIGMNCGPDPKEAGAPPNHNCVFNGITGYGISYAGAGLLAAGAGLTVGLPF